MDGCLGDTLLCFSFCPFLVLVMVKLKLSSLALFSVDVNKCPEASDNSFDLFESTQAMAPKSGTNWVTALVLAMTLGISK